MAVLAVDGGASKTDVAVVAADGTVLGRARGPASNHQMVGLDGAIDSLRSTVEEAFGAAGFVEPSRQRASPGGSSALPLGVYCLAGLDLPVDDERVVPAVLAQGWSAESIVRNDTFAVLRAGSENGWGVGVVCGTGLNCVGVGPDGASVRFPALGELSGDFTPGGAWLSVRGLGLALRAGDGRGRPTSLRRSVPAHLGLDSPEAVLEASYSGTLPFDRLMSLAEVVLAAAAAGDGPAMDAVDQLAAEVVVMVAATVERLGVGTPGSSPPVEVVTGGGLFEDPGFCELVLSTLRDRVTTVVLRPLAGRPPLLGAALLGLDAIGAGRGAQVRLRAELRAAG
ncbi:MAG TPA: BadF/BadG/BcrA/BcrD ATPase family protein [Acidimicrobiales bacterium]|nr:BadF/BadG/BcrA/BcrD ATPase family protein [Acidimicrobiales bacterium]